MAPLLTPLAQALWKLPDGEELNAQLRRGTPGCLQGLGTAGRSLLLAALAHRHALSQPQGEGAHPSREGDRNGEGALWITPTLEAAERLYLDAALFADLLGEERGQEQGAGPSGESPAPAPGSGLRIALFPERDTSVFDAGTSDPQRLEVLAALARGENLVVIAPVMALVQKTIDPGAVRREGLTLARGMQLPREPLLTALTERGYERVSMVELRGQFAVRGGLIDLYPSAGDPVRLEFFGDELESLRFFDIDTQRSQTGQGPPALSVLPLREHDGASWLTDHLPGSWPVILEEPALLKLRTEEWAAEASPGVGPVLMGDGGTTAKGGARVGGGALAGEGPGGFDLGSSGAGGPAWEAVENILAGRPRLDLVGWGQALPPTERLAPEATATTKAGLPWQFEPAEGYAGRFDAFTRAAAAHVQSGASVLVVTTQDTRLCDIFASELDLPAQRVLPASGPAPGTLYVLPGQLSRGFEFRHGSLTWYVLSDRELLGTSRRRAVARGAERGSLLRLEDLQVGDSVVHSQHGVGRFEGLTTLNLEGSSKDFLKLSYAKGDSVYVPVVQMDMLSKYSSVDSGSAPQLSRLGRGEWQKTRSKVQAQVHDMAEKLLGLHARRHMGQGHACGADTPWQEELEASFPFEETPDQARAIDQVKADLERQAPMDRLVCGDVGYGKTEVAIRAAFKAVQDGRQVAFLVPTTVLAQQHYQTLRERMAAYPVRLEVLSRFRSAADTRRIMEAAEAGTVDILVGTHRLLSKGLHFKRLGLLIIDEEQHFGVAHKERLKELKATVDVLTMSATPIPRTLQMALMGIRDLSLIQTPPKHRLPIKTYLFEHDPTIVQAAIRRELQRDGQVFFVHNRVQGIESVAQELAELVPEARIVVGHGQMPEGRLEKVMLDFAAGTYDVLVSTTIIESGLDMPSVNTIIINQAGMFGLGQLYQLRGRVGRGHLQGYCYLLYHPQRGLTPEAELRLETIREFTALGSGYQIAMRDLEIRGAGNMLGPEQSGQIAAVGFELYCQMLEDAIAELKGNPYRKVVDASPIIELPVEAFLPDDYVADARHKLTLYRRLAEVRTEAQVRELREELRDRFGPIPESAHRLLQLVELKVLCLDMGIPSIKFRKTIVERTITVVLPTVRSLPPRHARQLAVMAEAEIRFGDYQLVLVGFPTHTDSAELMLRLLRWLGSNLTEAMAGGS